MFTILVVIAALGVGYVAGRAQSVGDHHSREMSHWKAHVLAAALAPSLSPPTIDLTATEIAS